MTDDILQKAEALCKKTYRGGQTSSVRNQILAKRYIELCDFVPELVAEIKRLRENAAIYAGISDECEAFEDENIESERQLAAKDLHITSLETMAQVTFESHLQFVNAHFEQERRWEEESKTKDAEICKWQEVAIEATARGNWYLDKIIKSNLAYIPWSVKAQPGNGSPINDGFVRDFRERAAKELSLPHDSYMSRLERAYLIAEKRLIAFHYRCKKGENMQEAVNQAAREALEKIRHEGNSL